MGYWLCMNYNLYKNIYTVPFKCIKTSTSNCYITVVNIENIDTLWRTRLGVGLVKPLLKWQVMSTLFWRWVHVHSFLVCFIYRKMMIRKYWAMVVRFPSDLLNLDDIVIIVAIFSQTHVASGNMIYTVTTLREKRLHDNYKFIQYIDICL